LKARHVARCSFGGKAVEACNSKIAEANIRRSQLERNFPMFKLLIDNGIDFPSENPNGEPSRGASCRSAMVLKK
jgi:hypothetical protein